MAAGRPRHVRAGSRAAPAADERHLGGGRAAGSTPIGWIIVVTLLFGITLGTGASANQTALYTQVPAEQIGTASGLFRTWGYIGSIASSAIIAITFHASVSDHGLHVTAVVMIAVSAVALLLTVADRHLMRQAKAGPDSEVSQSASGPARRASRRG